MSSADKSKKEDQAPDIINQLTFKSRFVFIFGEINDKLARSCCERLIALSEESNAPIKVILSSPGGHVESGDAIHDVMKFIDAPITTIGSGWVASIAALIFLAAPKKRRLCLPNTRFMIHQPSGGMGGQASDIAIQAKEIMRVHQRIAKITAEKTGKSYEEVLADMDRDFWMSAQEAIDYGLVSRTIESHKDL